MTEPVKWNPDLEEWEYRCEDCLQKGLKAWWPLTFEFWSPNRGMNRCLACQAEYKAKVQRERRRTDPEYRNRCIEQTREQRRIKGHIYEKQRKRRSRGVAA